MAAQRGDERGGMGGGYASTVAPAKQSLLVALSESQERGIDGFAKSSAITASARLSMELGERAGRELPRAEASG